MINRNFIKIYLFSLLQVVISFNLYSQENTWPVNAPSPNAISLGMYGEIPVSLFTGTANINVPIYEIKGKGISVPISLSYHTSGNRQEMHPGWVGLGWNLNAGGAITRVVHQVPDETSSVMFPTDGYYYNTDKLNTNDWSSDANIKRWRNLGVTTSDQGDIEPDMFYFNFLGFSGKFFLDQYKNWRVQSEQNLKVIFEDDFLQHPFIYGSNYTSKFPYSSEDFINKVFLKFTLIDDKGTKYIFGGTESAIEYGDEMVPRTIRRGQNFTANTWMLTSIVAPNNSDNITFDYIRGPLICNIAPNATQREITGSYNNSWDMGCYKLDGRVYYQGSIIAPVYLTTITHQSTGEVITFETSQSNDLCYKSNDYVFVEQDSYGNTTGNSDYLELLDDVQSFHNVPFFNDPAHQYNTIERWKNFVWLKLDKINISGNVKKTVNLEYVEYSTERLKLKTLKFYDGKHINPALIEKYGFAYNTATKLPDYLAKITDHWGYFNNSSINPRNFYSLNLYPNEKQPNGLVADAEILQQITYPTGGTSSFEYELHSFNSYLTNDRQTLNLNTSGDFASGLRVKKVTTDNGYGSVQTKEYYYVKGYSSTSILSNLTSSGILDTKPQYYFTVSGVDMIGASFTSSTFDSYSIIPLTRNSTGTSVTYSEVVEKISDGSYVIHTFTNHDDPINNYKDLQPINSYNNSYLPHTPFISRDYLRGKPLSEITYDNQDNKVTESIFHYILNNGMYSDDAKGVFYKNFMICDPTYSNTRDAGICAAYTISASRLVLESVIEKKYNNINTNVLTTNKNYTYNSLFLPTSISTTINNGESEVVRYTYPFDYGNIYSSPYTNLQKNNIQAVPIEKTIWKEKTGTEPQLVYGEINTFINYTVDKAYPSEVYKLETKSSIPKSNFKSSSCNAVTGIFSFDSRYYQFAEKSYYEATNSNLTTVVKRGGLSTAMIYDYKKQLPIAIVKNGKNVEGNNPSSNPTTTTRLKIYRNLPSSTSNQITITTNGGTLEFSLLYTKNLTYTGFHQIIMGVTITDINNSSNISVLSICNNNGMTPSGSAILCLDPSGVLSLPNYPAGTYKIEFNITSETYVLPDPSYEIRVNYPIQTFLSQINPEKNIAYTSFEADGNGNWYFNSSSLITSNTIGSFTGRYAYNLQGGIGSRSIDPTKTYIMTLWVNGSKPDITKITSNGTSQSITGDFNFITTIGNWSLLSGKITGAQQVDLSRNTALSNSYIDEIRLYPVDAQMVTYTYQNAQIITSKCDANNKVEYYEYDNYGRVSQIKDQNKKVIKVFDYKYQDPK